MRFSRHSLVWLWLSQTSIAGEVAPRSDMIETLLSNGTYQSSPGTTISYANTSAFDSVTERWTDYEPPTYAAAISPSTEADVVNAVKMAKEYNVPILATGGRHGYSTTLGKMKDGIAIDLSQLNSVEINKTAKTLTVGPGVRFRDMFDPVYKAGFQIQTGTCSCVGMIGATLGGGIGRLHGLDGMIIDALQSVRLVTADGEVLEASEHSNPELFWGIRGAGFNFGIVLSATYELHPLYKKGIWTSADIIITAENNATYFDTLEKMFPFPAQMALETILNYNTTLNEPQLMISILYAGSQKEAVKAMDPILKLRPSYSSIKELTWNEVSSQSSFNLDSLICEDKHIWDIWSANLRNVSAAVLKSSFEDLASFWRDYPSARLSQVTYESWPIQATVAVSEDSTAYPWRDTTTYVLIEMNWDGADDPVKETANYVAQKIRSGLAASSGYGGLAVYVNYSHGDETLDQMYGASKLNRLIALKRAYDPNNTFRFYNALPTSYPK
ncbi:hypothetical protein F4805DRAFT_270517 [Annulohypoxylon moriforme]|nr:hypothetical protein F4805DRAFT_270517 [Annulohypoxylon moriforme]